ncbi:hypothetical protein HDU76_008427 [Blyttiomyces sp. JEL0837]|nr:hypothetical protein HDU76_008427 [Blyttiomyces sp. JEL0837]
MRRFSFDAKWIAFTILSSFLVGSPTPAGGQGSDHDPPTWNGIDTSYCGYSGSCAVNRMATMNENDIYVKGVTSVFYMQFLFSNRTTQVGNSTSVTIGGDYVKTASFFPVVDQYSEMVVPGSFHYLRELSSATAVPRVQMAMYFRGQLFKSGPLAWSKLDGDLFYVPARTIIVNLKNGEDEFVGVLTGNTVTIGT